MKLAIITVTRQGKQLSAQLSRKLEEDPTILQIDTYHKKVKQTLNQIYGKYDCILGIMASGIMIRSICDLIQDKTKDPAILIMDEKSNHVISLLSGHLGGANQYTLKIAEILGAEPVITTSTDVNNKIGIDSLASIYHFKMDQYSKILNINMALANNEVVKLAIPKHSEYLFQDKLIQNTFNLIKSQEKLRACHKDTKIILTPKRMVVGVGARRGVSVDSVLKAVHEACLGLGIPEERIDFLATAEPKRNEEAILQAADMLSIPLKIVSLEDLRRYTHQDISESSFVRKTFDVPGVCEPAALYIAGEHAELLHRKKAFNGVTVAIAVSK